MVVENEEFVSLVVFVVFVVFVVVVLEVVVVVVGMGMGRLVVVTILEGVVVEVLVGDGSGGRSSLPERVRLAYLGLRVQKGMKEMA